MSDTASTDAPGAHQAPADPEPTTDGAAGEGAPDTAAPGSAAAPNAGADGITGASDAGTQGVGATDYSGGSTSAAEVASGDGDGDIPADFPDTLPDPVIPEGTPGIGFDNAPVIGGVVVAGGAPDLEPAFPDRPLGPSNPPASAITSVPRTRVDADAQTDTNDPGDTVGDEDGIFGAESLADRSAEELQHAKDVLEARLDDVDEAIANKGRG